MKDDYVGETCSTHGINENASIMLVGKP